MGPSIVPRGTPLFIGKKGVASPSAITLCCLLNKKINDPINNVGIDGQFLKLVK